MAEEFEKQVVETQTAGAIPVEANAMPKNIKPVQQPVVEPAAPSPEQTPQTVVQKQPTENPVPEKKPISINQEFAKSVYDYTNKYSLMTTGKEINYDKFASKYFSSPQALESYYEKILPMSRILPVTISFKDKNDFINKAFTPTQEGEIKKTSTTLDQTPKDVSSFVRTPFGTNQEGYTENIQKAAQQKIDATLDKVGIGKQEAVEQEYVTPSKSLVGVDAKDLEAERKKAEFHLGVTPLENPETVQSLISKNNENLQKVVDNATLKNWDPSYQDMSESGIPEFDLKKAGLGATPKFTFNPDKLSEDLENYNNKKAFLTQYTDKDRELYGDNPIARLVPADDKIQFNWDANVVKNGSASDYWNSVPLEGKKITKVGKLLDGGKDVVLEEYSYKNKDAIPMMNVDGAQNFEIIKKLPAPAQKILDDYYKYVSNSDKEKAYRYKTMRETKETFGDVTDYWNFSKKIREQNGGDWLKEKEASKIKLGDKFFDDYAKSKGKMLSTNDEMQILQEAFNNQRRVIVGEFMAKTNPTDEDYKNTMSALGKIDMIWDLTMSHPENSNKMHSQLMKQDAAYLDYLDRAEREMQEKLTEEKFREEHPVIGAFRYNVRMPIQYGVEAGMVSLVSDIVDLPRKALGLELVSKEDINIGLKEFEKSVPTQLTGSIINDKGGIEFDNLLYQGAKVTTEMVGTMGAAKGFSFILNPVLRATDLPTKMKNAVPVAAAAFTQYRNDAEMECYNAMIDAGYSKEYAEAASFEYGMNTAVGWALFEPIAAFPLQQKFTKSTLNDFKGLLAKGETPFKAVYKSVLPNVGRVGKELLEQTTEEVAGDFWESTQNMAMNRRAGANILDSNMTLKDVAETGLVTTAVTLFGMGKRGDLYKSSISQKASVWNAVNNYANFEEQVDNWVKEGKLAKPEAATMKEGVKEVKAVITGLPADKQLTQSQKVDLGLLIYEKKKLDEEVKSGYVDELFRQQKMAEIEKKKKDLDAKILEVYNQNDDYNKVVSEREKIQKEQKEAQIEAEKIVTQTAIQGLKETKPVQEDVVEEEEVFEVKDGHHRTMARTELGETEIEAVDQDGNKVTVPIEQLQPTEDLATKDREVIDGLKESITKGEPVEPIKVEQVKTKENAKEVRSAQKRPNEQGQVGKVSKNNGGKNIQQQTQAGTETGDGKAQVLKKPVTKDEASRAHILNPNVNPRTADRAVTDLTTTTVGGKKIKATPSQVKVMAKEAGLEALGAKTPTQLYRQAKAQGIPMQEFLDAVDVGMGRKRSKVEPVVKEVETVKPVEEKKVEPEKPKSNELYNEMVKNREGYKKTIEEIDGDKKALKEEAAKSDNPEFKKGLESIESALDDPKVTKPTDLKVDGKLFGAWLIENQGNLSKQEYDALKEKYSSLKDKFGKKKAASDKLRDVIEAIASMGFVGTKTTNMGIFTIPINMPIAVAKGMAKVMLKGMEMYDNAIAGRDAIKYMKDSKWYKDLSSKEKNAVNKFLNGMDPFEAAALIIEDAASSSPHYKTGENLAKKVEGDIKAREKKVKSDKEVRDKAKAEEKKKGEAREKKTATKEFQRGAQEGYNFGEASGLIAGEIDGMRKGIKQGLKEGATNQKNISEKIKEYLKASKLNAFVSPKSLKSLISKAAKVTNEVQLENFLREYNDVLYRSVLNEKSKKALRDANKLKTKLKARAKKPKLPVSDVSIIKAFTSLNPVQVAAHLGDKGISEYTEIAQAILEGTGTSGKRVISNFDVQIFIDKVNNQIKEASDKRFMKQHKDTIDAMISADVSFIDENGNKVKVTQNMSAEEYRRAIEFLMAPREADKLKELEEKMKEDEERIIKDQTESLEQNVATLNGMIKSGEFSGVSKEAMKVIENISKLEPTDLSVSQLSLANIVISNIILNEEEGVAGAGRIEAIAISQQVAKELEKYLKDNNLESFTKLFDVPVLSEYLNEKVKTLPALLAAIGGTVEGATKLRTALKIQELASNHSQTTTDVLKEWNEGLRNLTKKYGKLGRPNIAITQHAENRFRQGMYAILIQNEGGSIDQQNAWVTEQKKLIEENLKQYQGNDKRSWKEEGELLNKIYNETFKNAQTLADVHKAMDKHKPDKEVVELAMNVFEKNFDKFEKSSLIYGNNKVKRWNNYTHKKWKKNQDGNFTDVFEEITDDISTSGFASSEVNKKESSSALGRMKVKPDQNKVLDLDFIKTQDMAINETMYHANTLGTRYAISEIINNPKIVKMLGKTNAGLIKRRMISAVNDQKGTTATEKEYKTVVDKIVRSLIRAKVITTLGGPTAYLRQMVGATTGAFLRSGFNPTVLTNIATKVDDNMFSKSNFRNRFLATKIGGMEKGVNRKSPAYGNIKKIAQRLDYMAEGFSEGVLAMKPLSYGDYHAAKGAWMTYYEQYKKAKGGKKVDWKEESKNPDGEASAYADQMIETSMNVNDMSMAGEFFKKQGSVDLLKRSILAPYGSFATNQDMRVGKAFRNLFYSPVKGSRSEAFADVFAVMGEQLAFQYTAMAMDALTAYLMINLGYSIFGGDDDEKQEMIDAKMKQIVGPGKHRKAIANMFSDFLPTSAIVSPMASNFIESFIKKAANDYIVYNFDLKDEEGNPINLFTTRYVSKYEDPNFAGSVSEESMMYFGLLGGVIDDVDNYFSEFARTWSGEYYKYDKEGKVKKVIKLDDRQQNLMIANLMLKTVGFFGVGNKGSRAFQNLFLKQIKTDLKESAKTKRGGGRGYGGGYSGGGYGGGGY